MQLLRWTGMLLQRLSLEERGGQLLLSHFYMHCSELQLVIVLSGLCIITKAVPRPCFGVCPCMWRVTHQLLQQPHMSVGVYHTITSAPLLQMYGWAVTSSTFSNLSLVLHGTLCPF